VRGLFDTDGTVFVANKPGSPNYPTIELTTTSKPLASQVRMVLQKQGFRTTKIWSYRSKTSRKTAYKVGLNGRQNLQKWPSEIGFSNPRKYQRARAALDYKRL